MPSLLRLADLSPRTYAMPYIDARGHEIHPYARTRAEVRGIGYVCPVGFERNGRSAVGVHHHLNWTPEVPAEFEPNPGRWHILGTTFADLTLKGVTSDSVLSKGLGCHFFIRNGFITFCSDSLPWPDYVQ